MSIFTMMSALFGCAPQTFETIGVHEFEKGLKDHDVQLVDVRQPNEYAAGTIKGAVNIDYLSPHFLEEAMQQLDRERPVYVFCRSGHRSAGLPSSLPRSVMKWSTLTAAMKHGVKPRALNNSGELLKNHNG